MSGQGQHGRVKGYVSKEGTEIPPMDFKMTNIGIGAIVKQIGNNKVAGFSMVYNFVNIGDEKKFALKNQKWLIRFYFGFRL